MRGKPEFHQQPANYEFMVLVPNEFCQGEPGDKLHEVVVAMIRAMVLAHYWPMDFGEQGAHDTELWFHRAKDFMEALRSADLFIRTGGNV